LGKSPKRPLAVSSSKALVFDRTASRAAEERFDPREIGGSEAQDVAGAAAGLDVVAASQTVLERVGGGARLAGSVFGPVERRQGCQLRMSADWRPRRASDQPLG
jgi:hypothetical protein